MCYQTRPFKRSWSHCCHCHTHPCTSWSSFWYSCFCLLKLRNLGRELRKCTHDCFIWGHATTLAPSKSLLSLQSLLYLRQSDILWAEWAPPCFLHKVQCFTTLWTFLGMGSLIDTIFLLLESPGLVLPFLEDRSHSVGKGLLDLLKIIKQVMNALWYGLGL